MKVETIGLNTKLKTFSLKEKDKFEKSKELDSKKGVITEVFINNRYGYEIKKFIN